MVKKTAKICCSLLLMFTVSACLLVPCLADTQLANSAPVVSSGIYYISGSTAAPMANCFQSAISAWGEPAISCRLNSGMSADNFTVKWSAPAGADYVIVPSYIWSVNNSLTVTCDSSVSGVSTVVDTSTGFTSDDVDSYNYSFTLYQINNTSSAPDVTMSFHISGNLPNSVDYYAPVFAPKYLKKDGGGPGAETSGGSGGETSGGSGGETSGGGSGGSCDCPIYWTQLLVKIDIINDLLKSVDYNIDELLKQFEASNLDDVLERIEKKVEEATSKVNSVIDGLSIPAVDLSFGNIPTSLSPAAVTPYVSWVTGLWFIEPLLTCFGICLVLSLILFGVRKGGA